MNNKHKKFSQDLLKILAKTVEEKVYGSVEIYFEGGKITQITQRIINKVGSQDQPLKTQRSFKRHDKNSKSISSSRKDQPLIDIKSPSV